MFLQRIQVRMSDGPRLNDDERKRMLRDLDRHSSTTRTKGAWKNFDDTCGFC